jgi:hypothetical protein
MASHPSGVSDVMEMESARSRPLSTNISLTMLHWTLTIQTARLVMGGGAGRDS